MLPFTSFLTDVFLLFQPLSVVVGWYIRAYRPPLNRHEGMIPFVSHQGLLVNIAHYANSPGRTLPSDSVKILDRETSWLERGVKEAVVVDCSGLTSISTIFQLYHDGVWLRQGAQCSLL